MQVGGNRGLCPFSVCCGGKVGEIVDIAINGSLLDTLVPNLKNFMMN